MGHYNTTNEKGDTLKKYVQTANAQEDLILEIFRKYPTHKMTPSYIWKAFPNSVPLTSIRRAISDLTYSGKLVKTDSKKEGIYGRDEYCWILKK